MKAAAPFAAILALAGIVAGCDRAGPSSEREASPSASLPAGPAAVAEQARVVKGRYAPRDECSALSGAAAFRADLAAAVAARDANRLIGLADPRIKLDFGGGYGTNLLRERLADKQYDLWAKLDEIVTLGCATSANGEITMPWLFAQDFGDLDVLNSLIVTGEDVPLHTAADAASSEVARVSWDAVTMAESWSPDAPFFKVSTTDGKTGYIARGRTRPIAGYRLIAAREGGKWRLTMFIAGD